MKGDIMAIDFVYEDELKKMENLEMSIVGRGIWQEN